MNPDQNTPPNLPASPSLTPALRELLYACWKYDTTNNKTLAEHLHLAPTSIQSRFDEIKERTGASDRGAILIWAFKHNLLPPPPESDNP